MRTSLDCIPCFVRQTLEAVRMVTNEPAIGETVLRKVLHEVSIMDFQQPPPKIGQIIHRLIREVSGNRDPYHHIKRHYNQKALTLYPKLKHIVTRSHNRFETSLRIAMAGNIIDFGVSGNLQDESIQNSIEASLAQSIDNITVSRLEESVKTAENILYLGDNSGEVVFDRVFIEEMPIKKITFVVRGYSVINDATVEDAKQAGIVGLVNVIDNGSDAPGTILEECSQTFREYFERSELIIAKGQGNFETLNATQKNIFFLFKVKCPVVASNCGHYMGSVVITQSA